MSTPAAVRQPQWRGRDVRAVLFDLDGTLLDTLEDITAALNQALAERQIALLPAAEVRELIGRGAPLLIARALLHLGVHMEREAEAALLDRFNFHCARLQALDRHRTRIYPGVEHCLYQLYRLGLRVAVVTNKQQRLASDLLQRLRLSQWIQAVVGGDSCERRKPDPQPLQFACRVLQVEPAQALMVGDSLHDVQAARAAGLPVVCVPYGYNEGADPRRLPCDALVDTLDTLPALLLDAVTPN